MKRAWKLSELQKFRKLSLFFLNTDKLIAKPSIPCRAIRGCASQTTTEFNGIRTMFPDIISLFTEKWDCDHSDTILKKHMRKRVSGLTDEVLGQNGDVEKIEKVLEEKGTPLFRMYPDGSALVELMTQLKSFPYLALEVINWRRKQLDYAAPMIAEEYTKGIIMAAKLKDVDLAVELFNEALNKQLKETSLYNALMSAYNYNGLAMKCQALFRELKTEATCPPSTVTYNIIISMFGRMVLVEDMEATLKEMKDLNLTPTLNTYKGLIAGYVTAWMWEKMERSYLTMKAGPIKPDIQIHMLMLRGYANSGQLEKMEEMYEMIRDRIYYKEIPLIRNMICAYFRFRNSNIDRVEKVEELLRLIPEDEYRPWLNVMMICLYAQEDLLEQMEMSINQAFEHKTYVTSHKIMKCITDIYFRHNAVDRLADFVQRAECAGWKTCRSLYHCKMVMYSSEMRLAEMERVLQEMYRVNIPLSMKTLWILFKSYQRWGPRSKLEQVIVKLCKHGCKFDLRAIVSW